MNNLFDYQITSIIYVIDMQIRQRISIFLSFFFFWQSNEKTNAKEGRRGSKRERTKMKKRKKRFLRLKQIPWELKLVLCHGHFMLHRTELKTASTWAATISRLCVVISFVRITCVSFSLLNRVALLIWKWSLVYVCARGLRSFSKCIILMHILRQ